MRSASSAAQRVEQVRDFFDQPRNYLERRRFDIRIRQETVRAYLQNRKFTRLLDIGCGDGSISLPFLRGDRNLTLLDVSPNMLSLAAAEVPERFARNICFVNGDFLTQFNDEPYDVVFCIGVLAHVSSARAVLEKIAAILKPGGTLILEFTDSSHPLRRLLSFYHSVLAFSRPAVYQTVPLNGKKLLQELEEIGFSVETKYRYTFPWPGMHRVASQETLYRVIRGIFGDTWRNTGRWLGSEYICCLRRR